MRKARIFSKNFNNFLHVIPIRKISIIFLTRIFTLLLISGIVFSQEFSSYPLEADYFESSHNYKKAIEVLKEGYKKEKNPDYLERIAKNYINLGQYRKAYSYAKKALQKIKSPEVYATITRALIGLGKHKFAFMYLEQGIKEFPDDTLMIHFAANVYDAMDSLPQALKFYRKILKVTDNLNIKIQYGSALVRAGYYDEAKPLLLDVEKQLEETDFRVEISLGTIYEKKKEYEKSLVHYSKANLLQPSNLTIPTKMALILMEMDSTEKALELLTQLERISPTNARIRKLISLIKDKSGDRNGALTERLASYALSPGDPNDEYYIARYLADIGELQLAERYLKKAIKENPNPDIVSMYAYLLLSQHRLRQARELLYNAIQDFPNNAYLNALTAYYFEHINDLKLAKKYYLKALARDSLNPKRYIDLATIEMRIGDTASAIHILQTGREKLNDNKDILFNLANILGQAGKIDQMEDIYKALIKTDTIGRAVIYNNWGYFLAKYGLKLNLADSLINLALKKEPDNPIFLDSKGWVEFQRGNYENALKYIKKAIENGAKDPEIFEHMGRIYEKLGDYNKAIQWYRRALKTDSSKKYLKERIKCLKKRS